MNDARLYPLAARALFAPFGGLAAIRDAAIDALRLRPGARVLELGCGPGDVTARLLEQGAVVEAVDASGEMLRAATARAPGAHFVRADIRAYRPGARFDAVLLVFVLHELPSPDVVHLLRAMSERLVSEGRLVIADHALPDGRSGRLWRQVLHLVESRSVDQWLEVAPAALIRSAGLTIDTDVRLAGGRVRLAAGFARPIS